MAAITSDVFMLLNVADGESGSASSALFYYIDKSRQHFYKFYTQDGTYTYSPQQITFTAYRVSGTTRTNFTGTIIVKANDSSILQQSSSTSEITINLNDIKQNISYLTIELKISQKTVYSQILDIDYGTSENMAKFAVGATSISGSVSGTSVLFNSQGITINNGDFEIINNDGQSVFFINQINGTLYFVGDIQANSGMIGGWYINNDGLFTQETGLSGSDNLIYNQQILRFWSGKKSENDSVIYNFYVTKDGILYANDANINGAIHATSGDITGKLLVGTTTDGIVIDGNTDSYISSSQYASGALGYGWKLSKDGTANFTNAYISGTLTSSVFEYDTISSVGGNLYVSPTVNSIEDTEVTSYHGFDNLDHYKVSFAYGTNNSNGFLVGQSVIISGDFKDENDNIDSIKIKGIINSISDGQIQIYQDTGSKGTWLKGTTVVNTQKGLLLTATEQNSPYMQVYDNNKDLPVVRIGNLNGIQDANFDSIDGYGLYSDNAYLTGQLILPNAGITNKNTYYYNDQAIRIWAGCSSTASDKVESANFIVTQQGTMIARKGIFNGTVNATNSSFSGVIRAAGIVIDNTDTEESEADYDHFFVAYSATPQNDDYVINIDKNGLSIWQGGFKVFSDAVKNITNNESAGYVKNIYGADIDPQPYISITDNIINQQWQPRLISYGGHFIQINKDSEDNQDYCNSVSVIINNGIWFGEYQHQLSFSSQNLGKIQNLSYQNALNKKSGIQYSSNSNELQMHSSVVNINGKLKISEYDNDELGSEETQIDMDYWKIKQTSNGLNFVFEQNK